MQEYDLPETARSIETSNVVPAPDQSAQQGTASPQHGHNSNQGLGVSNVQQGSPRSPSKRRADDRKGPCADCGTFGEALQRSHQICLLVALTVASKTHCSYTESLKILYTSVYMTHLCVSNICVYQTSVETVVLLYNFTASPAPHPPSCNLTTTFTLTAILQCSILLTPAW